MQSLYLNCKWKKNVNCISLYVWDVLVGQIQHKVDSNYIKVGNTNYRSKYESAYHLLGLLGPRFARFKIRNSSYYETIFRLMYIEYILATIIHIYVNLINQLVTIVEISKKYIYSRYWVDNENISTFIIHLSTIIYNHSQTSMKKLIKGLTKSQKNFRLPENN